MPKTDDGKSLPTEIKADYIKSNFFRVVHVDGVYGGVTPSGHIHMDVWNDRQPIPRSSVNILVERGDGPPELAEDMSRRESRSGIVREVEAGLTMDIDMARQMAKWLTEKANELERLFKEMAEERASRKAQEQR